jgi:hypothetical protein
MTGACPAVFLECDDGFSDVQLALEDGGALEQLGVEAVLRVQLGLAPHLPRLEKLKLPDDRDLVMLHVLGSGGDEHKRWLVRRFGDVGIRRWIIENRGRGLTVKQMSPWVSARTARAWQAKNPYALLWENR